MKVKVFQVGIIEANCYVVYDDSKNALIIDPGGDADKLINFIQKNDLSVKFIVNTHGHIDHTGANSEIKKHTKASICIHKDDAVPAKRPSVVLRQTSY